MEHMRELDETRKYKNFIIEKERTSPSGLALLHIINISKTFFEADHFHLLYLLIHI